MIICKHTITCIKPYNGIILSLQINGMKFIPYSRYTITTYLTENEVKQRLADQIRPLRSDRYAKRNEIVIEKPYEGDITENGFKVIRIANVNAKNPTHISGTIREQSGKTEIELSMRFETFGLVLFSFISVGFLYACFKILPRLIETHCIESRLLFVLFFPFTLYLIFVLVFNNECVKSERFFSELLEDENGGIKLVNR